MTVRVQAPKSKNTQQGKPKETIANMVTTALETLKSRNGSSLVAIKKFITNHYDSDVNKMASFIKRFLKSAVEKGTLIQLKGTGASGSFKLAKRQKPTKTQTKRSDKTPKARVRKNRVVSRTPKVSARKALFQTPQPGRPKPKARVFAEPLPCSTPVH